MFAAESRRKALVEAMLNFNPDLTIKGDGDMTALDYAEGDDEISSLIRERGGLSLSLSLSLISISPFGFCSLTHLIKIANGCHVRRARFCNVDTSRGCKDLSGGPAAKRAGEGGGQWVTSLR